MEIVSLGESLKQAIKSFAVGELIKDLFTITHPNIRFTWDDVIYILLNYCIQLF